MGGGENGATAVTAMTEKRRVGRQRRRAEAGDGGALSVGLSYLPYRLKEG